MRSLQVEQNVLGNLLDLFPEPAAIRNIGKDELAFIEREGPRIFVFAEDKLQRLAFHAPMAGDRRRAISRGYGPILCSAIGMQHQMLIPRTTENDRSFAPVSSERARIFRSGFGRDLKQRDTLC